MSGKRFAFNAAANWVSFAVTALVAFFLSPYLVSQLGPTQYGVWSLVAGLVGYLGLLDFGIRQAVNRYIAYYRAANQHEEASLMISAGMKLFGFLGIALAILTVALAHFTPQMFNIPPDLADEAQALVLLGGLTIAVSLVGGVFGGVVTGLERFDVHCVLEVSITLLRAAGIVWAVKAGHGLVGMATVQLAATVLNCVIFGIAIHRLYPQLRLRLGGPLGPQMRTILSFSASLTVLFVLAKIISFSDNVVIGAFLPIEAVTYYTIAGSLVLYAKEMTRSLSYVMTPRVSALMSAGQEQLGSVILLVAKLATLLSTPITLTFLVRGESFISLWMGPVYGPLSGEVLRVLALVVWLDASRSVVSASFTGMGKPGLIIPGLVVEAAANLVLSIVLVRVLGIVGVALGTLLPWLVVGLGYIPYRLRAATAVPMRRFWGSAILLPTLACIPFGIATVLLEAYAPARNLPIFFLEVLLVLPLVPLTAWFVCMGPEEKALARRQLQRMRG